MVEVIKNGKIVATSQNLRVITRYVNNSFDRAIDRVYIARNKDASGEITIHYRDGATCDTSFADYSVMVEWIKRKAHTSMESASLYVRGMYLGSVKTATWSNLF